MWLASADWMGRNLFRRVEVAFPVLDPVLRKRVVDEGLKAYLADNREAWDARRATAAGRKVKPRRGGKRRSAQSELLAQACAQTD